MAEPIVITPLREYRVEHGLSCEEFAAKLGVNIQTLRSVETGRQPAGIRFVETVATKCGLSLADAARLCGRSVTGKPKAKKVEASETK